MTEAWYQNPENLSEWYRPKQGLNEFTFADEGALEMNKWNRKCITFKNTAGQKWQVSSQPLLQEIAKHKKTAGVLVTHTLVFEVTGEGVKTRHTPKSWK